MIDIRPDQMKVFEAVDRSSFRRRVLAYLREAHGHLLKDMTEQELGKSIDQQTQTAISYGLKSEAAVVQFIEIALAFGEDFHASLEYPVAERILASNMDGEIKIQELLRAAQKDFAGEL